MTFSDSELKQIRADIIRELDAKYNAEAEKRVNAAWDDAIESAAKVARDFKSTLLFTWDQIGEMEKFLKMREHHRIEIAAAIQALAKRRAT